MPREKKVPAVELAIRTLRGQQVILDLDIAVLYEVPTKVLLQVVKRNPDRFPNDFVFRLKNEEFSALRSQIVTSKGRGGRRYMPLAFTAEGVAMLSGLLQSKRAVSVNISIMREFVKLRNLVTLREAVVRKLDALENKVEGHDLNFKQVFSAIQHIMADEAKPKPKIGFGRDHEKAVLAVKRR